MAYLSMTTAGVWEAMTDDVEYTHTPPDHWSDKEGDGRDVTRRLNGFEGMRAQSSRNSARKDGQELSRGGRLEGKRGVKGRRWRWRRAVSSGWMECLDVLPGNCGCPILYG